MGGGDGGDVRGVGVVVEAQLEVGGQAKSPTTSFVAHPS